MPSSSDFSPQQSPVTVCRRRLSCAETSIQIDAMWIICWSTVLLAVCVARTSSIPICRRTVSGADTGSREWSESVGINPARVSRRHALSSLAEDPRTSSATSSDDRGLRVFDRGCCYSLARCRSGIGRWTCDQQVAGSIPGRPAFRCNLENFFTHKHYRPTHSSVLKQHNLVCAYER